MAIDVIIVNWNAGNLLARCIESVLLPQNRMVLGNIWLIDNASTDSSLAKLPIDSKLNITTNDINLGFAKACNQGFKKSISPLVLLLNPDAVLRDGTLPDGISFMKSHSDINIMGCTLLDEKGKISASCARFPTPWRIFFDASGLSKTLPKIFTPATLMTDWDHSQSRKVDQVMGACMFIRRSLFEKVGYFDERFFVYFEELDFSKRIFDAGLCSFYNTEMSITHTGGGTTSAVKPFRLFLSLQSRLKYAKKHFKFPGFLLVWLSSWLIEPFSRSVLALIHRKPKDIAAIYKAYYLLASKGFKN